MASKAKSKPAAPCVDPALAEVVDLYGALVQECAAYKPRLDLKSRLEKEILSKFDGWDPMQGMELHGQQFSVYVSPAKIERKIDIPALFRRLGQKLFLQYAKFPTTVLDALVQDSTRDALCRSERSGTRSVKSFPKLKGAA